MPAVTGESFSDFYPAAYPELVAQLYGYSGDWGAAHDAADEALARAWPRWRAVALGDPRAWVARVGYRLVRRSSRSGRTVPAAGPDETVAALQELPVTQRRALAMSHLGAFTVAQIGYLEGVSEGTVEARLSRGRQALAAALNLSGPVDAVLDRLQRSVTTAVVAPELAVLEDRIHRRRTRRAVVGVAALVAVCAAALLSRSLHEERTPVLVPTVPDSLSATSAEPSGPRRADPAAGIPPGFLDRPLPAPSSPAGGNEMGVLAGCEGSPVARMSVVRGAGTDAEPLVISLYLYPDETRAHKVFRWIDAFPRACVGIPRAPLIVESWHRLGDESTAVTFAEPEGGQAHRFMTVRANRTILTIDASPSTVTDVEAVVEVLLARLCIYATAGCARADGLPAPLPALAPDGEAWLLMVPDSGVVEERGRAIATLAELGYRPGLVPTGCDLGDGLATGADRYLAVYFARSDDAQAVAARLGSDPVFAGQQVVHVRTECAAGNRAVG